MQGPAVPDGPTPSKPHFSCGRQPACCGEQFRRRGWFSPIPTNISGPLVAEPACRRKFHSEMDLALGARGDGQPSSAAAQDPHRSVCRSWRINTGTWAFWPNTYLHEKLEEARPSWQAAAGVSRSRTMLVVSVMRGGSSAVGRCSASTNGPAHREPLHQHVSLSKLPSVAMCRWTSPPMG